MRNERRATRSRGGAVSTPETELRVVSDTLLTTLDRLVALEVEKRDLRPDDPRMVELADQVAVLAAQAFQAASVQRDISETAHVMAMTAEPDAPTRTIEGTHRPLPDILEEWRGAERALAEAAPGSQEAMEAQERARALRSAYHDAYRAIQREDRGN